MCERLELWHLLAVVVLEQVNGLAPDHADHGAISCPQPHPLANQHRGIPAAHAAEPQVTVFVDVGHVETDLVDVTDDRQGRPASRPGNPGPG